MFSSHFISTRELHHNLGQARRYIASHSAKSKGYPTVAAASEYWHVQAILQNLFQSLLLPFTIFSLALCGRFQLLQEASINRWIGRLIKVGFLERPWPPLLKRTIQLVEDVSHDAISKVICLDDYSLLSPQEQRLDKVKGREIVCASENGCDRLVILTWSNLEIDFSVSAL